MTATAAQGRSSPIDEISMEDLQRLGIDKQNQLYWDGNLIEIKRRLDLTLFQKVLAGFVTFAAVLGAVGAFASGFNDAAGFLCDRGSTLLSCPIKMPDHTKAEGRTEPVAPVKPPTP